MSSGEKSNHEDSSVVVNGRFGKAVAIVICGLLLAGVLGVFDMRRQLDVVANNLQWISKQVEENTNEIRNLQNNYYGDPRPRQ